MNHTAHERKIVKLLGNLDIHKLNLVVRQIRFMFILNANIIEIFKHKTLEEKVKLSHRNHFSGVTVIVFQIRKAL